MALTRVLCMRMGGFIRLTQSLGADMSVNLGGGQTLVAQQFLDRTNVGAAFQQMSRERMAERVASCKLSDA